MALASQDDRCTPTKCGPNAQCRDSPNGHAICSCLPDFTGSPPNCRPECVTDNECDFSKACINRKCKNPCQENNPCARDHARCSVRSHSAVCTCDSGYEGNPYSRCSLPLPRKILSHFPYKILDFIRLFPFTRSTGSA